MDLSETHWTARGLFTFSLATSLIAVYYASDQHRVLGRCLNSLQIKRWIEHDREDAEHVYNMLFGNQKVRHRLPRKPAASSIMTVSAPVIMLSASVHSFLIGIGVYLGKVWVKELDDDADDDDSHNVFLAYIIGLTVCYGIYGISQLISKSHAATGDELGQLLDQVNETPQVDDFQSSYQGTTA
jgi:hypothetical protein